MNPDGSFPIPNTDIGIDINVNPDGSLTGEVWIDKGNGPMVIPGEQMMIWQVGYGQYTFENARGRYGIIVWDSYYGHYETLMISGPNTGTRRILVD
jgi:hypothetical protein